MRRILAAVVIVMSVGLVGAACAPAPAPPPTWHATRVARIGGPTTVNQIGAWTNGSFFATVRLTSEPLAAGTAELVLRPRGGTAATEQVVPLAGTGLGGPMGAGDLVGVDSGTTVQFVRRSAGTWAAAGTFALPTDWSLYAMSDRWMVIRRVPMGPGVDGAVRVYGLDASGPAVTAALSADLEPDPTWPAALREGFGTPAIALDGDLLAVAAQGLFSPAPSGVRVFRFTSGAWSPVQSLGATPGGPYGYGRALAVDDGPTVDRIAMSPQADLPALPTVEVLADTGSGFALEQAIPPTALPDAEGGAAFGLGLALDGNLLAVALRADEVPSAEPGHDPVAVGHVQMFRRGSSSWVREADVATFSSPFEADTVSSRPFRLTAAGNTVAVTQLVTPDPPVGCQFPCLSFGFEAWYLERY